MAAQALEVEATPRPLVRDGPNHAGVAALFRRTHVGVAPTAIFDDTFWELLMINFMITVLILWAPLLIFDSS